MGTRRTEAAETQALPDPQILELARLGRQVERDQGSPQDIEWAWAEGRLFLLQSRPVTSLYPLPPGAAAKPLRVYFSFGAVQGLLDPMTPLGCDFLREIFAAGSRLFGFNTKPDALRVLATAGQRLWIDITPLLRNDVGRRAARAAMRLVEPGVGEALDAVSDEPGLRPARKGLGAQAARRLLRFIPRLARNVALNLISPRRRRGVILRNGERILGDARRRAEAVTGDLWERLARRVELLPDTAARELSRTLLLYISGVASGMAPFVLLNRLWGRASGRGGGPQGWTDLALEVSRGMPHNPTTEMDLSLWRAACRIKADPASADAFSRLSGNELAARFLGRTLPAVAQDTLASFMGVYGDRGLAELDLGRPRWREDPVPVIQFISNYLLLDDPEQAPEAVFQRGRAVAGRAVTAITEGLARTRGGRIKVAVARRLADRTRALLGLREAPKFFAVRMIGIIRRAMRESGAELAAAGVLEHADDLLFLRLSEMRRLARREPGDWRGLVASRRAALEAERGRRQIPRVLLSDGRAFYEGISAGPGVIQGAPVSPGAVEGAVRVVMSPRRAEILPGEIMVCPGTDPSWTPLFLTAGGLIMEVGGMMTHGAVVAREYGIPAVVGVHEACTRLRTGQRIRLDGSTGRIVVL